MAGRQQQENDSAQVPQLIDNANERVYPEPMTTGSQFAARAAEALRIHPATFERYLQNLAQAGLIRRSGKGGGRAAVHLHAGEYATILLALAAPYPSSAAEAARALGQLGPEKLQAGDATLRTLLTFAIETYGEALKNAAPLPAGDDRWELELCLDPLGAKMVWPSHGPDAVRIYAPYPLLLPHDPPAVRRHTVLTVAALMVAAESYAR